MNPTLSKGFTLLEILIAVFIFGAVLSIVFTSYTGTFRIIDETESYADIYGKARIALERMQEDLQSAYFSEREKSSGFEEETVQPARFVGEDKNIKGRVLIQFVSSQEHTLS